MSGEAWYKERLHSELLPNGYAQCFQIERVLHEEDTDFQKMMVFETRRFGRVLALDGVIQTTEGDEFVYHEMISHVPLFAHGAARQVLIIGGGDGGVLREVLRHPGVERATMVEIDRAVVDICVEHMPSLSAGAFDNPRAELIITDGIAFVRDTERRFDVIIVDSTDPIGPGEVLFTSEFYASCKRRLSPGGILVTQNGVPFFQPGEIRDTHQRLGPHFADVGFYYAVVPTYIGGMMTLAWATDDKDARWRSEVLLAERFGRAGISTRYYSPGVHVSAFVLPPFIAELMPGV